MHTYPTLFHTFSSRYIVSFSQYYNFYLIYHLTIMSLYFGNCCLSTTLHICEMFVFNFSLHYFLRHFYKAFSFHKSTSVYCFTLWLFDKSIIYSALCFIILHFQTISDQNAHTHFIRLLLTILLQFFFS